MSKNQKTYLLLLAVALVWGAIGYQIYSRYNPDTPVVETQIASTFIPNKKKEVENYTINPDYRDPFLGKIYRKPKPKVKQAVQKPQVVFPPITYNGIIKGETKAFIISINGQEEIFKLKQVIKGVELIRGNDNEIIIKYQGERKKYPILR